MDSHQHDTYTAHNLCYKKVERIHPVLMVYVEDDQRRFLPFKEDKR